MSKLTFIVGPVACGKTVELIINANQLQNTNGVERIKILKPSIDTRFSSKVVKSASGLQMKLTDLISPVDDLSRLDVSNTDHIIVDEIQFFTVRQIDQLRRLSVEKNISISCYGLLKDFKCCMFDASKRLMEVCDDFRQLKTFCMYCKENGTSNRLPNEATVSMKISKSGDSIKPVIEGDSICIGGIETFIPVCYSCYYSTVEKLTKL